ncbi:TIGR02117 family protein [Paraflavisolibacter sp. H34]|uniref:TIGR02117 family protein n=1 Tax=Huijunlia imazamoxiresistens TaxID=3127457 RepID=UPI00301A29FF
MKKIRKPLRVAALTLLVTVSLALAYLLSAFVLSRITVDAEAPVSGEVTCYLLTNGVHTDLVVPVKSPQIDWSREIRYEYTRQQDSTLPYLALGWGDKGFYLETPTWADLKFRTAFRAAFALNTSALHATFYRTMKEGSDCVRLPLSQEQYGRLVRYIRHSFLLDSGGHFQKIATTAVYGANDAFYEAVGSYSLLHTCNTWANNGLKSCGQKAALWTPFDTGIFYHYKKITKP